MAVTSLELHGGVDAGPLEHYFWYFTNDDQIKILLRTFGTSLLVAVLTALTGFPYAYLMTLVKSRWRITMMGVVLLPFCGSLASRKRACSAPYSQ